MIMLTSPLKKNNPYPVNHEKTPQDYLYNLSYQAGNRDEVNNLQRH